MFLKNDFHSYKQLLLSDLHSHHRGDGVIRFGKNSLDSTSAESPKRAPSNDKAFLLDSSEGVPSNSFKHSNKNQSQLKNGSPTKRSNKSRRLLSKKQTNGTMSGQIGNHPHDPQHSQTVNNSILQAMSMGGTMTPSGEIPDPKALINQESSFIQTQNHNQSMQPVGASVTQSNYF